MRNRNHCIKRITKTAVAAEATASNGQKELKFRLKTHTQHICTGVCIPTQTLTDTYRRNFGSSSSNNNKMIHKATRTNTLYTRCRYQISECVCMAARCLSSFTLLSLSLSLSLNQNRVPALSLTHSLLLIHSFIHSRARSLTLSIVCLVIKMLFVCFFNTLYISIYVYRRRRRCRRILCCVSLAIAQEYTYMCTYIMLYYYGSIYIYILQTHVL